MHLNISDIIFWFLWKIKGKMKIIQIKRSKLKASQMVVVLRCDELDWHPSTGSYAKDWKGKGEMMVVDGIISRELYFIEYSRWMKFH